MDGYSQDDTDMLGNGSRREEHHDSLSIDSALNSIFSDEGPIAFSEGPVDVHDRFHEKTAEPDDEEPQGIDLDRALDSIFSDEHSDDAATEDEDSGLLSLDEDVAAAGGMEENSSLREAGGADTVPLEYELSGDEYDEELVAIFLKKLTTDIDYIQARIAEYRSGGDKKTILEKCHDAIGRLASSANYMEYISLTEFCETWQSVTDGYLADVSSGVASDIASGMQEFIDRISSVYPQITEDNQRGDAETLSNDADAGKDNDKDNDTLFSIANELLSASEKPPEGSGTSDPLFAEKKKPVDATGAVKKIPEKSATQAEQEHSAAEEKTLFDTLSNALELSESAAGSAADSIDSVIEEIMEAPGEEDEYVEEIEGNSPLSSFSSPSPSSSGRHRETAGAEHSAHARNSASHLLDNVAASNRKNEIAAAAPDDETDNKTDNE
ncbi:MAG: hypothetical protein D3914_16225, partial [Candidatus Electrothrix sp. LOE2]|nr:hypothetical protein [Candidatus Electrothrix sp. LOE2]